MTKWLVSLSLVLVLSVGLAGCTTTDSGRTKAEGTAVGAGAGALLGAIIGGATGGGRGAVIGGAIGAAAGGAAGYAYGTHVANKKAEYASREDWLDDCIASAHQVNAEAREYNAGLAAEIEELDAETARLAQAYEQKTAQREELVQEKARVEAKLEEANKNLDRVRWELENQEKVLAEARSSGNQAQTQVLEEEVRSLRDKVTELESHTETLASLSGRMAV